MTFFIKHICKYEWEKSLSVLKIKSYGSQAILIEKNKLQ